MSRRRPSSNPGRYPIKSSVHAAPKNYPANAEAEMIKVDFAKMAADRDRVLAEWTKRYDAKSAPKN